MRRHGDVVDVRAVIVTPADVQAHAIARNAGEPRIDRGDMQLELLQERPLVQMRRRTGAAPWPDRGCRSAARGPLRGSRGIRCASAFGQRHQVGLVAVVVLVDHRRGDDAGRRRGHEGLAEARAELAQPRGVLADRRAVDVVAPQRARPAHWRRAPNAESAPPSAAHSSGTRSDRARAVASTRRRSRTCSAARRSGSRRATARRRCRCRRRP